MRILFTTEYYPPFAPGGSPWSIRLLAEALVDRGHSVTVVTPNYGAAEREEVGGVTVVRFPFWKRLPPGSTMARARDFATPRFHFRLYRALLAEGRRFGADVVHAQDKHSLVGSFFAARRLKRPVFLTVRNPGLICPIVTCLLTHEFIPADCSSVKLQRECASFYLDRYTPPGRLRRARVRAALAVLYADAQLKRLIARRLDGLVGVSRGLLEIYLRAGWVFPGRGHVIYSLPPPDGEVDPAQVGAMRESLGLGGRKGVLYVGKLSIGKGGPVFLAAAERVAAERPDTVFVVVGPDELPPVAADVHRLKKRLSQDEMAVLYRAVDLVVVPSVGPEALSRVPLEAAMAERATVGARAGGIPEEIVDGNTGFLVARGDAEGLARAIARLLGDDELRAAFGRNARAFVNDRFGTEAIIQALIELYTKSGR
jgi:glycosyltransferase involved in cell wall biosynthesis